MHYGHSSGRGPSWSLQADRLQRPCFPGVGTKESWSACPSWPLFSCWRSFISPKRPSRPSASRDRTAKGLACYRRLHSEGGAEVFKCSLRRYPANQIGAVEQLDQSFDISILASLIDERVGVRRPVDHPHSRSRPAISLLRPGRHGKKERAHLRLHHAARRRHGTPRLARRDERHRPGSRAQVVVTGAAQRAPYHEAGRSNVTSDWTSEQLEAIGR
jgi:hypothetical protein